MIRLLIDQDLPWRAAGDLRARGWDVQHLTDLGMQEESDAKILEYAVAHGPVLVTRDGDFAQLMALGSRTVPSVIHVRIQRVPRARLVSLLQKLVPRLEDELRAGCMVSVRETGARVRRLPIG